MQELLKKKNRSLAGSMAPANGLYLMCVEYPSKFNLPIKTHNPIFFI